MSDNGGTPTKRVELEGDQWATFRTYTNAADMRLIQEDRLRVGRGGDPLLDSMAQLPSRMTEWSRGPITKAAIDALRSEEITELIVKLLEVEREEADAPNSSTPSSTGSSRRGKTDTDRG